MLNVESFEITLEISRTDGDDVNSFKVPVPSRNSRVLDALLYVRHNIDPSLGFRYSCRAGMCGSCAVVINGKEGLSCQTTIGSLQSDVVRVEPMRALPVLKDVMCDIVIITFTKSDEQNLGGEENTVTRRNRKKV